MTITENIVKQLLEVNISQLKQNISTLQGNLSKLKKQVAAGKPGARKLYVQNQQKLQRWQNALKKAKAPSAVVKKVAPVKKALVKSKVVTPPVPKVVPPKGGEGKLAGAKKVLMKHPKTAAAVAGVGLGIAAVKIYKRHLSKAARACKGLSGQDKTKCMFGHQARGVQGAIGALKSEMSKCGADPKCKAKIQTRIAKYNKQLAKIKSRM